MSFSEVNRTHTAGLVVFERLTNFLRRIHHERSITRNRFTQRPPTDKQHTRRSLVFRRFNPDFITISLKTNHHATLNFARMTPEKNRTGDDVSESIEVPRYRLNDFASWFEHEIQIENRCARFYNGADPKRFTRQDTHYDLSIRCPGRGYFLRRDLLIVRTDHLVCLRKVDPELHAVKFTSRLLKFLGRFFGMDNAAACGHPLHVAGVQLSFVSL